MRKVTSSPDRRDYFSAKARRYGLTRRKRFRRDESPEAILARCAIALNCEPRQVYDKLLERLKERAEGKA